MVCGSLLPLFCFKVAISTAPKPKQPKTRPLESTSYELQIHKSFFLIFMQNGLGWGHASVNHFRLP